MLLLTPKERFRKKPHIITNEGVGSEGIYLFDGKVSYLVKCCNLFTFIPFFNLSALFIREEPEGTILYLSPHQCFKLRINLFRLKVVSLKNN